VADGPERGIDGLAAFVASREPGDRNKGLFWAACRAAEDGLDPAPLAKAAEGTGMDAGQAQRTIDSAAKTITRAREQHGKVSA
jgi:hypothetical protein